MRTRRRLRTLCGVVIVGILICTLWPFDPFPTNAVGWLPGARGIKFGAAGVVASEEPLRVDGEATDSCTLEVLIRPAAIQSVYTILGFYTPNNPRQFLMRQWTDGLLVSHAAIGVQNKVKSKKFDVDHAFQPGKLALVTITSGPDGTDVYLDGQPAEVVPKFRISRSDLSGQIVMGTSPIDYQPWPGEIRGLAVYSKELSPADALRHYGEWRDAGAQGLDFDGLVARYAFTEGVGREIRNEVTSGPNLKIPEHFLVPHKAILASPAKEFRADWRYLSDVLLNIAGFVPLGFILCAYYAWNKNRRMAISYTILTGGLLSLVIEVLQAYIPRRVSGTTDIITNTLGAALGAWLAQPAVMRGVLRMTRLDPDA